jgi:uncharacterized phage-associated protein
MRGFNYKKAVQALNIIALKSGGTVNKMKAIKLIWLADRLHLRKYGRTITGDVYFALPHGPVPSTTKDIVSLNSFTLSEDEFTYIDEYLSIIGRYDYQSSKEPYLKVFSKTDIASIEEVYKFYGKYDQYELRDISHRFPEWKRWEQKIGQTNSRFLMDYRDFFKDPDIISPLFKDDPEDLALIESLFFRTETRVQDAS